MSTLVEARQIRVTRPLGVADQDVEAVNLFSIERFAIPIIVGICCLPNDGRSWFRSDKSQQKLEL
jgi:hypothetical protein